MKGRERKERKRWRMQKKQRRWAVGRDRWARRARRGQKG